VGDEGCEIDSVADRRDRPGIAARTDHCGCIRTARQHVVGALEHVLADLFERRRQPLENVLIDLQNQRRAPPEDLGLERDDAPRLLPEVNDVRVDLAQQGPEPGVEMEVPVHRPRMRQPNREHVNRQALGLEGYGRHAAPELLPGRRHHEM